jgi:glycine betaine/proline transport system permease protein
MLALSMAVVAAMISVAGLGQMVLRGIGQLDVATATTGGVGIVLLAITIDRISQGLGMSFRERGMQRWFQRGPIGLVCRGMTGLRQQEASDAAQAGCAAGLVADRSSSHRIKTGL